MGPWYLLVVLLLSLFLHVVHFNRSADTSRLATPCHVLPNFSVKIGFSLVWASFAKEAHMPLKLVPTCFIKQCGTSRSRAQDFECNFVFMLYQLYCFVSKS